MVVQGVRWRQVPPLLLFALWLLGGQGRAESGQQAEFSRIQRPHGPGVVYLAAAAAAGQLGAGCGVQPGYSLSLICRPHRAADFLNSLYALNTALVLQVDKQGDKTASILSGDLVLRRYLGDMRALTTGRSAFIGLGAGISHVAWGPGDRTPGGSADNFSFLAEAGLEWNPNPKLVLVGKGQYRLYNRDGHDHSGWSVHLGAGLPLSF